MKPSERRLRLAAVVKGRITSKMLRFSSDAKDVQILNST